ncbi:hypothetical protein ACIF83_18955 [Streptomyces sp. NPDC085866]
MSHAVIDQAIGVVMTVGGLRPDQGIEVLIPPPVGGRAAVPWHGKLTMA